MDPLAEKILTIKKKRLEEEEIRKIEAVKAQRRKDLIIKNRTIEYLAFLDYLKKRIETINKEVGTAEIEYVEGDKTLKIFYGGYYMTINFDYIYSNEPEGTQIIITVGRASAIDDPIASIIEDYYWIPKVPDDKILWTICNNYHIEGDIKNVTMEEMGNFTLERFVNMHLGQQ